MPGRNFSSGNYRYGFNGMERDDEVSGNGNSLNTPFRQYDPRLGRWMSLDPLMAAYPHQSAYAAYNNNPIYFADPTGLEGEPPNNTDPPRSYLAPTGYYFVTTGISNVKYFNGTQAKVDEDEFGNDIFVTIAQGAVKSFEFEGETYTPRGKWMYEGNFKFTAYRSASGKEFVPLEVIEEKKSIAIDLTLVFLNDQVVGGEITTLYDPKVLWSGKTISFDFNSSLSYDSDAVGIGIDTDNLVNNPPLHYERGFIGTLFFTRDVQDFRDIIAGIEKMEISYTGLGVGDYLSAGSTFIQGSKNFNTVFMADKPSSSLGVGLNLNASPVSISGSSGSIDNVNAITAPNRSDSTRLNLNIRK